jgi:hypothetical protein
MMVCAVLVVEDMKNGAEKACGPLRKELLKSWPTQSTQKSVASQLMFELPVALRAEAEYEVLKAPVASVLI